MTAAVMVPVAPRRPEASAAVVTGVTVVIRASAASRDQTENAESECEADHEISLSLTQDDDAVCPQRAAGCEETLHA